MQMNELTNTVRHPETEKKRFKQLIPVRSVLFEASKKNRVRVCRRFLTCKKLQTKCLKKNVRIQDAKINKNYKL